MEVVCLRLCELRLIWPSFSSLMGKVLYGGEEGFFNTRFEDKFTNMRKERKNKQHTVLLDDHGT